MSEEEPIYPPIPHAGDRFVHDLGFGFTTGLAGSSIFSLFGGLRRGGAARAISARAAGTLAAYLALVSALENAMDLARPDKEDLWNGVAAGAVSWAAFGVRRGAAGAAVNLLDGRNPLLEKPPRQQPQTLRAPTTPEATGFWGMPHGPPIVVEEVAVGDQSSRCSVIAMRALSLMILRSSGFR